MLKRSYYLAIEKMVINTQNKGEKMTKLKSVKEAENFIINNYRGIKKQTLIRLIAYYQEDDGKIINNIAEWDILENNSSIGAFTKSGKLRAPFKNLIKEFLGTDCWIEITEVN